MEDGRTAIEGSTPVKSTGGGTASSFDCIANWNCVNPARFLLGAISSLWEQDCNVLALVLKRRNLYCNEYKGACTAVFQKIIPMFIEYIDFSTLVNNLLY